VGFNTLLKNQLLGPAKMLAFLSLASLIALSHAAVLPAGVSAAACPNYPYCGPSPANAVPGAASVLAAQEAVKAQLRLAAAPAPPQVPGNNSEDEIVATPTQLQTQLNSTEFELTRKWVCTPTLQQSTHPNSTLNKRSFTSTCIVTKTIA